MTALARRARPTNVVWRVGLWIAIVLVVLPSAFVFFWMVTSSLKPPTQIYQMPPLWIPTQPTLDNYIAAFAQTPFLKYALNSAIVATGATLLSLVLGAPAAYVLARHRIRGGALAVLSSRILPGVAYLVPLFVLFGALRMIGSYPALILSHVVITLPLTVFIMLNFFEALPQELYDAGAVDGMSRTGVFVRIALPLTRPGLATAGILAFIYSWNDFKMALVLSNSDTRTLPIAVFNFVNEASLNWGPMMAYTTIIAIPVLILAVFAQRHIVTGMTLGSVK